MKVNKIRTAAIVTVMAVITTAGVFAQKSEKKWSGPDFRGHYKPFNFSEKQVMGTISSVNADAQIIVLTDADGKSRKVHINPLTNIVRVEPNRAFTNTKKGEKKNKDERPLPFKIDKLSVNDLKAGHWITVQMFSTDTETIEGWNISVHNWRQMLPAIDTSNAK